MVFAVSLSAAGMLILATSWSNTMKRDKCFIFGRKEHCWLCFHLRVGLNKMDLFLLTQVENENSRASDLLSQAPFLVPFTHRVRIYTVIIFQHCNLHYLGILFFNWLPQQVAECVCFWVSFSSFKASVYSLIDSVEFCEGAAQCTKPSFPKNASKDSERSNSRRCFY